MRNSIGYCGIIVTCDWFESASCSVGLHHFGHVLIKSKTAGQSGSVSS